MKRITIKSVAVLFVIGLAACSSLRTDSVQGKKDSTGGLNVSQSSNQSSPGAQDVNQRATDTRVAKQPPKVSNSPGAVRHVKYAQRRGKSAKPSTAITQRRVRKQVEYVGLQIIETQDVTPVALDVIQPTEVIEAQPVQVIEQPAAPAVIPAVVVDMNETIVMPQARSVYVASPVSPECYTGYETWVEFRDP